jgi:hypothetical protein
MTLFIAQRDASLEQGEENRWCKELRLYKGCK